MLNYKRSLRLYLKINEVINIILNYLIIIKSYFNVILKFITRINNLK